VKSGESLSVIAQKHGTTVKKLCQLNGLTERSVLQIGQKIKLP
jgi:LysM repeat protein